MVDRKVIRYECRCGREGVYSIQSLDWITNPLFGKKKGPRECLRCQQTICQSCQKGKFCEFCSDKVPSHLISQYKLISSINIVLIVPLFLAFLAIIFKISDEFPFTIDMFEIIIIGLVILFRVVLVIIIGNIRNTIYDTPESETEQEE